MHTLPVTPGKVVVVGQGYVGLPLAVRAVEVGYDVVGFDVDERRIADLAAGRSYVEDIPGERLRRAAATGRYTPSADPSACAGFSVAVISVPTPLHEGNPDLSYIEAAAVMLSGHLEPGATVILESTTYPGTTEELVAPLLESRPDSCSAQSFRAQSVRSAHSRQRVCAGRRLVGFGRCRPAG